MGLKIKEVFVEFQKNPIGLDEKKPRFSWLLESDEKAVLQTECRILMMQEKNVVWDTGMLKTDQSMGIAYEGEELQPCTAYQVKVTVKDNHGNIAEADSFFETGFLDETINAWEGAKWIGAPRYTVCAKNRGVFVLETEFRMEKGSQRAGIVFGANDFRLLDRDQNELGIEGENFIRYEWNLKELEQGKPMLDIYRVGYALEDKKDIPFASIPLVNFEGEEKTPIFTKENSWDFHKLRIEVEGNTAKTYVDDILVDAVLEDMFGYKKISGRVLNPRGHNDVLTYPRLNEIGFYAGEGDKAFFKYLKVRNVRRPFGTFIYETPQGNGNGGSSIFAEKVSAEDGCFVIKNQQITADPSNTSIPMLRTSIQIEHEKKLKRARLYITSRGIYDCKVNGLKLTERLLLPGSTQYDKRLNYQTYDITDKLTTGKNGVGVTLSSGWWSEAQTFTVKNYNFWGDKEALLAKIVVEYEDGTRDVHVTNTEEWKYFGEGPYLFSGFFAGECFDARRAEIYETYANAEFDDRAWEKPAEIAPIAIEEVWFGPPGFGRCWPAVNRTEPKLLGEYDAPVYIVEQRTAKTRRKVAQEVYIYDLEQEMAGVPRITLHEEAGTRVRVRYAEMLYPDMPEYAGNEGRLMVENYRDATSMDEYICCGKAGEVFQPKFTFHGYRYIEISGVKNPPAVEEVISLQYSSVTNFEGSFESSHALLNRFAENVRWSQKCNFINIPTDCPQRNERLGWAGDTHVFCHTALNNANLKNFYERNLKAMEDLQTEEGQYPEIAPVGGGFGGITYECATIFMAWELYQQYGDKRTLERFYPGMKKYMNYMKSVGLPGRGDFSKVGPLGDWLAPTETDLPLMWNAFYYREAYLMEKISKVLGFVEEQKEYAQLALEIKAFWNRTFVLPENGKTCDMDGKLCDTQCSYVLALAYEVAEDRETFGRHLIRKTKELDYKVGTGFFGTGPLNPVLTELGETESAYRLMLQTECPSWLYPVTQGATSIWEHWDSYTKERGFGGQNAMNSFNHYSLGSVLSWMYHTILGIKRDENVPGFQRILLKPELGALEFAKGSVSSPYGTIYAGWKKEKQGLKYECKIPVNTTAEVQLPDGSRQEIGSGAYEFMIAEGDIL